MGERRASTIHDYTLQQELGEVKQVRLLNANASLVFSPRLLALASEAESAFIRFDEHLETSPLKECISLAIARFEAFALAAVCGSELSFAHFIAPESLWPGGEDAVKANARKYWDIVKRYHDPDYIRGVTFDASFLARMHADLLDARCEGAVEGDAECAGACPASFRESVVEGAMAPEQIPEYVDNLMAFSSENLYPIQVQSCVTHLQIHYISPYHTLNGPLGNVLSYAIYAKRGFSKNVIVTIGATTLEKIDNPIDHYKALSESPNDPYGLWVYHAAKALQRQIGFMKGLEEKFSRVAARWEEALGQARHSPVCMQLAHDLLSLPLIDSATLQERYGRTAPAANSIITMLVEHGILTPVNANKRYRLFSAREIIDIYYDAFSSILPKGWVPANFTKLDLL